LAYAYRIPLNNGIISLGLQAGVLNTRKDYSKLLLRHDGDPNFPQGEISAFMPVFGTGVFYSNDRLFAGLSVPYLGVFNRGNGETQAVDVQEVRHFILNSGYLFDLSPDVMFKPSVVVRVANGSPIEYDLNGSIILKQTYWFGLSYRHQTSLNFMTQLQITQELQMGYSFDLVTGSLRRATSGSHEIMLNYRIRSRKGDLPLIPGFF
jgi:type IX secretion system PorP/SprF family membrane protein